MADKEKILVVDDEPSIRKYLQTLLEVDGFDVETVSNGKDALERIGAGERPDFVILDVLMPEMDGLETLRQLMQVDRSSTSSCFPARTKSPRWSKRFASARSITSPSRSRSRNSTPRF